MSVLLPSLTSSLVWCWFAARFFLEQTPCFVEATGASATTAVLHTTTNVLRQPPHLHPHQLETAALPSDKNHEFMVNTYNPHLVGNNNNKKNNDTSSFHLPWGELNILVVTDVHSWIAGNHHDDPGHWPRDDRRPKLQDADYGDVLGFYQHLQSEKRDIFFVMNGDFVDGTGLSGVPPVHLAPLLEHMPWDAINVGNHELYHRETIAYLAEHRKAWNGAYLSSNTLVTETMQPLGVRYTYLEGKHSKQRLLVFGFLFDFHDSSPAATNVPVEQTVKEEWFIDALAQVDAYDGILVMAHMDCLDPLVTVILEGIRRHSSPGVAIQFLTGHTHRRCHARLDPHAQTLEAGRFLDTIGFVSFSAGDAPNFQHSFLDVTKSSLRETLKASTRAFSSSSQQLETPAGVALSDAIRNAQRDLGLDTVLGCAPQTYGMFDNEQSSGNGLWELYLRGVLPDTLLAPLSNNKNNNNSTTTHAEPIFFAGTGTLRYSLFEGPIAVNDVIAVSPFNDTIVELVPNNNNNNGSNNNNPNDEVWYGWELSALLQATNRLYASHTEYGMPAFEVSFLDNNSNNNSNNNNNFMELYKRYRLFTTDYDSERLLSVMAIANQQQPQQPWLFRSISTVSTKDGYYLTELWKEFVRTRFPCPLVFRKGSLWNALPQMLVLPSMEQEEEEDPPSQTTSQSQYRRTILFPTESLPFEDLKKDQRASVILVVLSVLMIAVLLVFPPTTTKSGTSSGSDDPNNTAHKMEQQLDVHVQLIPLCRHGTGNWSGDTPTSYGSIQSP